MPNKQIIEKRKINAWVLGTISIGLSILGSFIITNITDYLSIREILNMDAADRLGKTLTAIYYGLVLFLSIFGLIRGIVELRSPKKRLAIIGLILCFVSIVVSLFMAYLLLAFYAL